MSAEIQDRFRYLPVTDRVVRWGLYLVGCGHLRIPAQGVHPPTGHPRLYSLSWQRGRVLPEYQVVYLLEGRGMFESALTGKRALAAGDVFLLFPGVWHRYRPLPGSVWETRWMGYNGAFAAGLVQNGLLSPESPVITLGQKPELVQIHERLLERVLGEQTSNPLLYSAAVMEILAWLPPADRSDAPQPASRSFAKPVIDRLVAEAVRWIWSQTGETLSVSDVAAQFPVARRSLERRFHRVLGHTILEEITRCHVERAKRLLVDTDLPLKAVALASGFSGPERMSKVFHRVAGATPAHYRRANKI